MSDDFDVAPAPLMERVATLEAKVRTIEAALTRAFGHGWLRQIAETKHNPDGTLG